GQVDVGGERLRPDVHVQRKQADIELALNLRREGRGPVDDDGEAVAQASATSPATTRSVPYDVRTSRAPSSSIAVAMPRSGARSPARTSTAFPRKVER